ncbi:MAG TPA: hypothetical protein VFH48_00255 [Chloroflexota bacterium]|nr:hypothetical protein [Chloroflexota bacterium]
MTALPARPAPTLPAHPTPTLPERLARPLAGTVGIALSSWTLALYGLTFLVVHQHYREYPPHYDSIGLFAGLFEILNETRRHGIAHVLPTAFGTGLTWLQPAYALALWWAPIKTPEGLVSLNFLLLLAAQAAIVAFGRTHGFSRLRQVVSATIPVVPGALYAWDGGIQDLRRDVQLVLLALAILFLSLAYVRSPGLGQGVCLGMLVGLAQWSRDNAAAIIVIASLPAIVLAIVRCRGSGGIRTLARFAVVPIGVFLAIALPYYAETLPMTIERYRTNVWGVGESRVESLLAFWNMPLNVLLGGDSRLSGRVRVALVTAALLFGALAAVYALWRARFVTIRREHLRDPAYATLLASGAWVVVAVFLYNTLLLGYGARWHGMPFMPIMVGVVAMMLGLAGAVRRAPVGDSRLVPLVVAVGCLALLIAAPLRMVLNQPKAEGVDGINALRAATVEIGERAGRRPVAFLAYDTLSRHHFRYYTALDDRPGVIEFELLAKAHGEIIDLDQPARPGDDARTLQARLDDMLGRWADFALVYTDTNRYADPRETLWPYQLGKPVVDKLLADPAWQPVAHFTLRERDLVLLENTARPASAPRAATMTALAQHVRWSSE